MKRFTFILFWLALAVSVRAQDWSLFPDYMNPDCDIDERVEDLIHHMTLEDKVAQMETEPPRNERLGIAGYSWWSESIHGVGRAGKATVFPIALGLAATFDLDLMTRVATVISDEARAKHLEAPSARYHGLTYWAPSADLVRDPRWGRAEETYGEDPFLTSRMDVAYIKALQGYDPHYLKIAATPKHFAVHGQETGRHSLMVDVSERNLQEYYLATFRACFTEAKAASCMAAYNGVNGYPSTINHWLLTELLRNEWGFDGPVVTDWGAPRCLVRTYKFLPTFEDAVAWELRAGVDVICQSDPMYDNILNSVLVGITQETELDNALRRSLKLRFRLGLFDPPERVPYNNLTPSILATPEHVALSLDAAREAIVLLKNGPAPGSSIPTPILPLDRRKLESIAVIGSHANRVFLGNYSGTPATSAITTYQGITNHLPANIIVRHVPWVELEAPKKKDADSQAAAEKQQLEQQRSLDAAVQAAANSDVAVVVVGLNPTIEMEGRDRTDMDLPKVQEDLIEKVVAVNPATIVILINGSPVTIHWIQQHVPAVVEAWYPGEQGGTAIADVLFGDYNPAGRLPLTFYASPVQLPPLDNYDVMLGRTYMYLRDTPLYPFGHGLSYTTFQYQNLKVNHLDATTNDTLDVSLDLANTGARDGDEVVQLYVRNVDATVTVPFKQLRGFQRVRLASGEIRSVTIPVKIADLGYWDELSHRWVVGPGRFEILVGASSADIRQSVMINVR